MACGSTEGGDAEPDPEAAPDGDDAEESAEDGQQEEPPDESGEATSEPEDGGDGDTRTVAHDLGEAEVPAEPERVVALDSPHLDAALSLGVDPVGAVEVFAGEGLPAYLDDQAESVVPVGTIEEPDLEAIVELEPDLILTATVRHEGLRDELEAIAPTVFTQSSGTTWQDDFQLVADTLGRAEAGEEILDDYEAHAASVGETVGAEGAEAAVVRFLPDETRVYGPETFSGRVLREVGFELPELEYDEYSMALISPEQIGRIDTAEVIFATAYGDPAESTRGEVTSLWEQLPAVGAGCQFDVADDDWMIGIGPIGAEIILEDVLERLQGPACP
ncbi:iron-siderophore ABC transporter substrate-binding protein [Egibacter rhizosphaerae]|uniref:Iron-siderophore ABC transporter substrate-binding protein n=1 Tax=Egibacter rhizosphaerae TaxID=1670831 RepID=A0A411YL11_9ACTN|nr:iron-siderophore ABC transporter substrate-binding protein [Egibacter rhizosphaerae]